MAVTSRLRGIKPRLLGRLTLAGIALYILIDLLLTFLRPDYSPLHNAESDFGRGPYFWLMDINFLLRCLFSILLARGLTRFYKGNLAVLRASTWLYVWAIASGLLAFFADNPSGQPHLKSGSVHVLLALIAFIAALVAMFLMLNRSLGPGFGPRIYYSLAVLTSVAVLSLFLIGRAGISPHRLGGLFERIFLGSVLIWEAVLASRLLKPLSKQAPNRS